MLSQSQRPISFDVVNKVEADLSSEMSRFAACIAAGLRLPQAQRSRNLDATDCGGDAIRGVEVDLLPTNLRFILQNTSPAPILGGLTCPINI